MIHLIQAYRARIWLAQGEPNLASSWASAYERIGPTEYLERLKISPWHRCWSFKAICAGIQFAEQFTIEGARRRSRR
jgi:hypothetical protein